MKILAIDSSSMVATVGIWEDDVMVAEYTINHKKTHSQTLLPMIDEIVKMTETDMESVDAIAITGGPGSYTGLRIGSATAKGIGLAINKPIINIPTMDAMAYNFYSSQYLICPMMDARRSQVYTGLYRFDGTKMETMKPQCIMMIQDLVEELEQMGLPVMFLGDGVPVNREFIDQTMKVERHFAPASMNRHRAAAVASLAAMYYREGKTETAEEHKPDYLRASQAERELKAKQNNDKV
ncbi:MAG: tRNA (adenosine(37)-N6)-threonylcarbamoyltransferase complex dimerization subunit type 1 TsaB [Eubacterium sp.]|nr:tRNA (adenosine(37)-N6)-threonylcarbamoyltransferase complex dimerization subunit type 1 TsaB [Eubacterium sp.]